MNRFLALSYGAVSYLLFLVVFVYAILFVGDLVVPRTIDNAIAAPVGEAMAVDVALLTLFALQHSVMARPAFKKWWTRLVPQPVERSTYVLFSSAVLALLLWQWRSIPTVVWDVSSTPARLVVWTLFWLGWGVVLASTFMISHFELFGLRQVFALWRGQPQHHGLPHDAVLPGGASPVEPRFPDCVLGGADDDGRTPAVRGRHDGVDPVGDETRGTRPRRDHRTGVRQLSAPRSDDHPRRSQTPP
jgi:protein-S-isoprenylcysteine O-methyltransferase Ste14